MKNITENMLKSTKRINDLNNRIDNLALAVHNLDIKISQHIKTTNETNNSLTPNDILRLNNRIDGLIKINAEKLTKINQEINTLDFNLKKLDRKLDRCFFVSPVINVIMTADEIQSLKPKSVNIVDNDITADEIQNLKNCIKNDLNYYPDVEK